MKQKFLQVITAMLLIVTLTMANFVLLCVDVVSYAAEIINMESSTNHRNVEYMAYFKDAAGNKVDSLDAKTNSEDLKLYFQVSVKKEGYFNGNITLNNANFKLKSDVLSDGVNKIENNTVYLNQINAGESKEIEVGIELLKNDQFDLNYLNMESSISINGIYRDSTQKDISIKADRDVTLNFVNPYSSAEEAVVLSQNIITNKIFKINGEEKRIVQLQVTSGLNNDLYPVSKTSVNIQTPKISDKYPENVLINANETLVTTGKTLSEENWKYDKETGKIEINLENTQENGMVSWLKNGNDNFVVTYIYDKDVEFNNDKSEITSQISLLDKNSTVYNAESGITITGEEKNSIVTASVEQNEQNIYKGKLYAGISRDVTYKNIVDVNLNNVETEVDVKENDLTINGTKVTILYKTSKFDKAQVEKVLGENGRLIISNANTGAEIAVINKNTDADENGKINISYPENVDKVIVKVSEPENIGRIEIETTKSIEKINRDLVKQATAINGSCTVSYVSENKETELNTVESNINLLETETSADLQINRTELSAMTTNNNVEFRVTLKSREEKNELFKNPVVKIELPEKIKDIQVNSINLLYEDELKIKSAQLNGNTIEITMQGEQTKYKEEAIDGATIIVNANLATDTKIASSTEQVKVTYTNANAINYSNGANVGIVAQNIDIVSYAGVVTTNQVEEYGIDLVNNQGANAGELPVSTDTKTVNIQKRIINNKENKISNVKILGAFPTKDSIDSNSIDIEVGNIAVSGIDANRAKVYYSDNANATEDLNNKENNWSESIADNKNVKKYLVVLDGMELQEEVDLSYPITIPANLEYNESAEEGYTVYYTNLTSEEKVDVNNIRLATPKGAVIDTTLKALVAGNESSEVKENEVLRYAVVVSNTGSEDMKNIKVSAKVPDGTTFVNSDQLNNEVVLDEVQFEDSEKKDVEFNIDSLAQGQTITKYYEVKVNDGMANKEISNTVTTQYGEITKTSNEVKTNIKEGKVELKLISTDATDGKVEAGYSYRYVLLLTNKSDKDIKNVNVKFNTNDTAKISKISYTEDDSGKSESNVDNITLNIIKAGETKEILMYATMEKKDMTAISAKVSTDKVDYNSNEISTKIDSFVVLEMKATSENSGNYVKSGDKITYKINIKNTGTKTAESIVLKDWFDGNVALSKVLKNGEEIQASEYTIIADSNKNKSRLGIDVPSLNAGESVEYQIEVVVNTIYGNTSAIEIINEMSLEEYNMEVTNAKIQHILQPDKDFVDVDPDDNNGNVDPGKKDDSSTDNGDNSTNGNKKYVIISGTAWVDADENGQKDNQEQTAEGITVKLLDVTTNKFVKDSKGNDLEVKTSSTGFYSFDRVQKGQYLVVFEYDTTKYGLTTFEKSGVSNEMNSKVVNKTINVDGTDRKVAATEIINVDAENIANINIGLITAKTYDLQLDKYISKVTVQNNKTVTNSYNDVTLAKAEIDAKQVNSTTVVVEYTIKVTNKGDVTAYVKKIADYLSSDFKFSSELNKDWYQSGNTVYCSSLSNEKLEPGESKEVTLTVIKQMKENNTGLVNNTAEIAESYNELGLTDVNSTEGNKVKGENDMGSADLIISIRTGQVVTTVLLIISSIVILGVAIYFIRKLIINRNLI